MGRDTGSKARSGPGQGGGTEEKDCLLCWQSVGQYEPSASACPSLVSQKEETQRGDDAQNTRGSNAPWTGPPGAVNLDGVGDIVACLLDCES
jgi:hypothetical protein